MTEHGSHHHRDRSGGESHRTPDAFDELVVTSGLADLADRGSRLDRLPIVRTVVAFVASMFVSQLVFGVAGGVLVVVMAVLPLVLAAALVRDGEVSAGRATLRLVGGVLMVWMAIAVLLVPPPSLEGPSAQGTARSAPDARPSPGTMRPAVVIVP